MNISKFLLIDIALAIAAIPLLFLVQGRNKKSPIFFSSNKDELLEKTSINLPEKEKLIDFEKLAKRDGSGIEFDALVGVWKFVSVWKKDTNNVDSVFSSFLRVFSAKLEIKNDISNEPLPRFSLSTSIQFGLFSINFSGSGYLKGKQPLLIFFFNLIEVKSGLNILLSRSLKEPEAKKKSFFAVVASGESGRWLSARGQGGALILWLKD